MKEIKDTRITIRLSQEKKMKIKAYCEKNNLTMSAFVIEALINHMEKKEL